MDDNSDDKGPPKTGSKDVGIEDGESGTVDNVENNIVESEKPKETRDPSPEPSTSLVTASSSSEDRSIGGAKRRSYRSRQNDSSSSSSDGEKKEEESKEDERKKNKKKRFLSPSSVSSSSSSSGSDRDEFSDASSNSHTSTPEAAGNSYYMDLDVVDNAPRLIMTQRRRKRFGPGEKPYVLKAPEAKAKNNFVKDFVKSQMHGDVNRYTSHCTGQLSLVKRFELGHKLSGHRGCVNSIHFNESGSLLASGSDDLKVFVWDWQKRKKLLSFNSGHTQNVFQSKFLPFKGDTHLVTASRDGQVRLAELSSTGVCRSTRKLAEHSRAAHKLALLDTCPHTFLSAGEDGLIIEIDVRQPKPKILMTVRDMHKLVSLYSIHANPANDYQICTSGRSKYVTIFDRRYMPSWKNSFIQQFSPRNYDDEFHVSVTCALYSHDGKEIVASYNDDDIYLFDVNKSLPGSFVKMYQGHLNSATVKGVNFYGPKSEYIVSGSDCGNIFIWDKDSESIVHMFNGDVQGVVNCLEPHPHLPVMATSGLDKEIKMWYPSSKKEIDTKLIEKTVMKNQTDAQPFYLGDQMLQDLLSQIQHLQENRGVPQDDSSSDDEDIPDEAEEEEEEEEESGETSDSHQDSEEENDQDV